MIPFGRSRECYTHRSPRYRFLSPALSLPFFSVTGTDLLTGASAEERGATPENFDNVDCKLLHLDCISGIFNFL